MHSCKDVQTELESGFAIGAILERADPADAFVSNDFARLDELPQGACVGTSSLRRQALLRALRPDLELTDLRGNVNTRLAKLDEGRYAAIILACAGLERLGLGARVRARLVAPTWVPAVAQGAIAIEQRLGDNRVADLVGVLDDPDTRRCVEAERAMNLALHGSCHVPVAGFCTETEQGLELLGLVGDPASGRLVRAGAVAMDGESSVDLGKRVAAMLFERGAGELLAAHAG